MAVSLVTNIFIFATGSFSIVKRILTADEIIIFNNEGRNEVVPRSEYTTYIGDVALATPEQHNGDLKEIAEREPKSHLIEKRCEKQEVFTLLPTEKYINWDVPMSGVIHAPADSAVTISVSSGKMITNKLKVSGKESFDAINKFLLKAVGVSYSKSWTTRYTTKYSFKIPAGRYGAIVLNPITTRHSGFMDTGCIGNTKRTEFSGESYESKAYSKMKWVDGIIGLCLGDTYPLLRCLEKSSSIVWLNEKEIEALKTRLLSDKQGPHLLNNSCIRKQTRPDFRVKSL
ncbi:hypothetical protein Golomagni_03995 [Golovinomyces magnicellulatus]|nr:hypothetical protein Golomagni_03995 [Golovinomyces magnicellulatus]